MRRAATRLAIYPSLVSILHFNYQVTEFSRIFVGKIVAALCAAILNSKKSWRYNVGAQFIARFSPVLSRNNLRSYILRRTVSRDSSRHSRYSRTEIFTYGGTLE